MQQDGHQDPHQEQSDAQHFKEGVRRTGCGCAENFVQLHAYGKFGERGNRPRFAANIRDDLLDRDQRLKARHQPAANRVTTPRYRFERMPIPQEP